MGGDEMIIESKREGGAEKKERQEAKEVAAKTEAKEKAIDAGRVCIKLAGRDAGRFCVITNVVDANFVEITGPKKLSGVKRKRANVAHLEALPAKIEIKAGASDEEVEAALKAARLATRFKDGLLVPRA